MTVRATYGLQESIRKGWGHSVLAYVDHPDGEVWMWSGVGTLTHKRRDYVGVGHLGNVSNIGGAKKLAVRQIIFKLSGIPTEATRWLNSRVRGRAAKAWIAGMRPDGQVNGEAWLVVNGQADYQELVPGAQDSAVNLYIADPIWSIERVQNTAFTPTWIKSVHGDHIMGLDDIPGMRDRTQNWTRT